MAIELRHISCQAAGVRDVSFSVRRGEIMGVAGLVGSGRTELAKTLFGLTPADSGELIVHGHRVHVTSPAQAIECGIAYLPEDRRQHGVVPEMAVSENVSLANLSAVAASGLIDRSRERDQAQRYVEQLRIKTPSVFSEVESLSGGNQQKVALAKWLSYPPRLLVLCEPTRGMDVGAKNDVIHIVRDLRAKGLAIIVLSTEPETVLSLSDRVIVLKRGAVVREFANEQISKDRLLEAA
jgi:ribose transport system ATP-binding protein